MPATSRQQLLEITDRDWARLADLLATVPDSVALAKDENQTSIKDIVGHRAHWIELFLGWYEDGQAGRKVHFPAPGYKWNELKAYNAKLRADQAGLGWSEVCKLLRENHTALRAFIAGKTGAALYGAPMKGARNDWTTGRWAEAAGPSHYRSAIKYIRTRRRALA